jgi:phage/plasmid-associated DNA primase
MASHHTFPPVGPCTERVDGGFEAHKTLYGLYKDWCKDNGETPCGGTEFGRVLTTKGYTPDRGYL